MATNKVRTLAACRALARKYRNPEGKVFFSVESCPLCTIHCAEPFWGDYCSGCPLNKDPGGSSGCVEYASFDAAWKAWCIFGRMGHKGEAFEARAAFFDRIIPILEALPPERFTKAGWEPIDEISLDW